MAFFLYTLNSPYEFQMPAITPTFGINCTWISTTSIFLPGLLVAFLHRFDKSRSTNIYIISSITSYFFGSIIWNIICTFSRIPLPFDAICPPFVLLTISFMARRSSGSLSGDSIEPETSRRKTRLRGGSCSALISWPCRPRCSSRAWGFHGQSAISLTTEKGAASAGAAARAGRRRPSPCGGWECPLGAQHPCSALRPAWRCPSPGSGWVRSSPGERPAYHPAQRRQ